MPTVVIGVDNSAASTRAVEFALRRATREDLTLVLAHVINWSAFSFNTPTENEQRHIRRQEEIKAAEAQVVRPMREMVEKAGVPVTTEIRHGHPAESIIDLAEEKGAEHIIVGRTGDSGIREQLFGSVALRLIHTAPVPVTVVP